MNSRHVKRKIGTVRTKKIEYLSTTVDRFGRCSFMLTWIARYHPGDPRGEYRTAERGQVFFADPRQYGFPWPKKGR